MVHSKKAILRSLTIAMTMLLLWSCGPQTTQTSEAPTSLSKEIKEVRPGILEGYLAFEEMPNSLLLVPPPPEEGSAALELDMEAAKAEILLLLSN